MKILIVTDFIPYPPTSGSKVRVFNLLKQVSRYHDVSLLALCRPSTVENDSVAHLEAYCTHVELVVVPWRSKWQRRLWALRWVLKREPLRNAYHYFDEVANRLNTLIETRSFDIVDIQRSYMAPYVDVIAPECRCRKILTLYDIDYTQYRRILSVERNFIEKIKLFYKGRLFSKRALLKYAGRFDTCVVVSDLDRDALQRAAPVLDVAVVPNGVDAAGYSLLRDWPETPTLLFVGTMSYPPNADAALFFCEEIFPLIKERVPDAKLLIVGRKPAAPVRALASADVIVTGFVESVIPYYERSSVSVVPLRAGGGTRLKILESMALGRPVVSTTIGCEGLQVTHNKDILIADTPTDFAAQIVRLLSDETLRKDLVTQGRQLVETRYDWKACAQQLMQVYEAPGGE